MIPGNYYQWLLKPVTEELMENSDWAMWLTALDPSDQSQHHKRYSAIYCVSPDAIGNRQHQV